MSESSADFFGNLLVWLDPIADTPGSYVLCIWPLDLLNDSSGLAEIAKFQSKATEPAFLVARQTSNPESEQPESNETYLGPIFFKQAGNEMAVPFLATIKADYNTQWLNLKLHVPTPGDEGTSTCTDCCKVAIPGSAAETELTETGETRALFVLQSEEDDHDVYSFWHRSKDFDATESKKLTSLMAASEGLPEFLGPPDGKKVHRAFVSAIRWNEGVKQFGAMRCHIPKPGNQRDLRETLHVSIVRPSPQRAVLPQFYQPLGQEFDQIACRLEVNKNDATVQEICAHVRRQSINVISRSRVAASHITHVQEYRGRSNPNYFERLLAQYETRPILAQWTWLRGLLACLYRSLFFDSGTGRLIAGYLEADQTRNKILGHAEISEFAESFINDLSPEHKAELTRFLQDGNAPVPAGLGEEDFLENRSDLISTVLADCALSAVNTPRIFRILEPAIWKLAEATCLEGATPYYVFDLALIRVIPGNALFFRELQDPYSVLSSNVEIETTNQSRSPVSVRGRPSLVFFTPDSAGCVTADRLTELGEDQIAIQQMFDLAESVADHSIQAVSHQKLQTDLLKLPEFSRFDVPEIKGLSSTLSRLALGLRLKPSTVSRVNFKGSELNKLIVGSDWSRAPHLREFASMRDYHPYKPDNGVPPLEVLTGLSNARFLSEKFSLVQQNRLYLHLAKLQQVPEYLRDRVDKHNFPVQVLYHDADLDWLDKWIRKAIDSDADPKVFLFFSKTWSALSEAEEPPKDTAAASPFGTPKKFLESDLSIAFDKLSNSERLGFAAFAELKINIDTLAKVFETAASRYNPTSDAGAAVITALLQGADTKELTRVRLRVLAELCRLLEKDADKLIGSRLQAPWDPGKMTNVTTTLNAQAKMPGYLGLALQASWHASKDMVNDNVFPILYLAHLGAHFEMSHDFLECMKVFRNVLAERLRVPENNEHYNGWSYPNSAMMIANSKSIQNWKEAENPSIDLENWPVPTEIDPELITFLEELLQFTGEGNAEATRPFFVALANRCARASSVSIEDPENFMLKFSNDIADGKLEELERAYPPPSGP